MAANEAIGSVNDLPSANEIVGEEIDGDDGRNLIVNYIPQTYSESDLLGLFEPYGQIESCKIVSDYGKSLGYGFVKFYQASEAENAMSALSGARVLNKVLKVSVAKPATTIPGKGANLYVSNLDPESTEQTLHDIFQDYGTIVEAKILIDFKTNQCKGVGFVRMASKTEALAAIRALNGQSLDQLSKRILVKFADNNDNKRTRGGFNRRQNEPYNQRYDSYSYNQASLVGVPQLGYGSVPMTYQGGGGAVPNDASTLFVYNIPPYSDDNLLYQLFCPFGAISSVKIVRDESTQMCKGYGFVSFMNIENAQQAVLSLNGQKMDNKFLQVSFKKNK